MCLESTGVYITSHIIEKEKKHGVLLPEDFFVCYWLKQLKQKTKN